LKAAETAALHDADALLKKPSRIPCVCRGASRIGKSSELLHDIQMADNCGKHAGRRLLENRGFVRASLEVELIKSLESPIRPLEKNWASRTKREARGLVNKATKKS
jgi:hypothetical protein